MKSKEQKLWGATMNQREQVAAWIQWSRENLPTIGDIPKLNVPHSEFPVPWDDEYHDLFIDAQNDEDPLPELLACFGDELSRNPADLAVRFTALNLYHKLPQCESIFHEDLLFLKRKGFRKQLAFLVRFLEVDECPGDWRIMRWEILNSYAIRDWNRALELYDRAERLELLDRSELQLMRGEFRFLVVFGPKFDDEFDPVDCEPKMYGSQDFRSALSLILYGLLAYFPETTLDNSDRDGLRDAAADLEKALDKCTDVSPAYRSILARCHFSIGHFHDAGREYELLLLNPAILQFHGLDFREGVYVSVVTSYRRAQETQRAIELCRKWVSEFPDTADAHVKLAQLYEDAADYVAACTSYREAVRLDANLEQAPGMRTAEVLAEIWPSAEADKSRWKATEEWPQVQSLLTDHWRPFSSLSEKAKEEWTYGALEMHFRPAHGEKTGLHRRKAVVAFATAVEQELAAKVFSRFREDAARTTNVRDLAEEALDKKSPDLEVLAKFILEKYPYNKESLTLGAMEYILTRCGKSALPLFQELHSWVARNYPRVLEKVGTLRDVVDFRNPAAHGNAPRRTPDEIAPYCMELIESISSARSE